MSEKIIEHKELSIYEKNIHQRLHSAMEDLKYIQKSDKKVNDKYRFASHDSVAAAIHKQLVKHRMTALPVKCDSKQDGNRTEIKLTVRFTNIDLPTDFVDVEIPGAGLDPADKGAGKAISYAFKYAMLKSFCLETGDDPDNDQTSVHESAEQQKSKLQAAHMISVDDLEKVSAFVKVYPNEEQDHMKIFITRYMLHWQSDFDNFSKKYSTPDLFLSAYDKWKIKNITKKQQAA